MNKLTGKTTLILIAILGINILSIMPSKSHPFAGMGNQLISETIQQTSVNISAANLGQPHLLKISGSGNKYLSGTIELNGKTITNLIGSSKEVNLSSYLRKGTNTIDIVGRYSPTYVSIKVEFSAPNTVVSQEASGQGILNQKIVIIVE